MSHPLLSAALIAIAACAANPAPAPGDPTSLPDAADEEEAPAATADAAVPATPVAREVDAARAADVAVTRDGPPPVDTDAFFGASRCPNANVMFCEDFESGALDPKKWTVAQQKAIVGVDQTRAARGKYALHVRIADITAMYGNRGHIATKSPFPIAGNHLFVRAFVYIQANPDRWFTVLGARATDLGYSVTVVPNPYGTPGQYRFLWFHNTGEPAEKYAASKAPVGRWACWEWEIRGATNEMTLSIDDKPVPNFAITAAMGWTAPATAPLTFGYDSAHPEPNHPAGFDLWVDEIAVNGAKIGCAP